MDNTARESGHGIVQQLRSRLGYRSWPIRLKLVLPISLIIMVLIGTSFLATTWIIRRFQDNALQDALIRAEQVVETLLTTQRQTLI